MRDTRFNIVLIGMGEPLHNYDETMKAVGILADEHGFELPARRVTLSTVGLLPALERLAKEPVMPNLAISLHAPTDLQRGELVPINRKYGPATSSRAMQALPAEKRSRITFEYVLLAGVNDSPCDARRLAKLVASVKSKVNLIPLNAAAGIPFRGRQTTRSTASRRLWPITASRCRCARAAAATFVPPAWPADCGRPEKVSRSAARRRDVTSP
jgi:23S rRNA (adenine2503-C2)-methyltransferase